MSDPLRFTLPVTVGTIRMHVDRSVSVTVRSTTEMDNIKFAVIHEAFQKVGWFLFAEDELGDEDVPTEHIERNTKSQAQTVRKKCYQLHKRREEAGEDSDCDTLYRQAMSWLIEKLDKRIAEYD